MFFSARYSHTSVCTVRPVCKQRHQTGRLRTVAYRPSFGCRNLTFRVSIRLWKTTVRSALCTTAAGYGLEDPRFDSQQFHDVLSLVHKFPALLRNAPSLIFSPLNAELNPICYLLALLGVHHFLHVSKIRVKSLTLRLLMSHIYMEHLFLMFLDHTQRRITVGRPPLDE